MVKAPALALALVMLLMLCFGLSPAFACPPDGTECRECILDRMKYGCPNCVPILRCMARCLWSGTSRSKCVKKCDCGGGDPTLQYCKKCMSRCKCSCTA
ncbi:hypothetical protein RJ641_002453 [Dillenia turbinata]|uniref:Uncharacterized protein n=1 Tax=Dillenia turbinata TaxID=194707 RepID=A0AAN8VG11_9MAGN